MMGMMRARHLCDFLTNKLGDTRHVSPASANIVSPVVDGILKIVDETRLLREQYFQIA